MLRTVSDRPPATSDASEKLFGKSSSQPGPQHALITAQWLCRTLFSAACEWRCGGRNGNHAAGEELRRDAAFSSRDDIGGVLAGGAGFFLQTVAPGSVSRRHGSLREAGLSGGAEAL